MKLSDCADGKDNNFNLIRVLAALTVLLAHSFPLAEGHRASASFIHAVAGAAASVAVYVFFVVSGFLVTRSMLQRESIRDFLVARAFRIYPALWLVTTVLVFIVGPLLSSLPIHEYFSAQKTYFYLLKVFTLIFGVAYNLPGVFESNPFPSSVNGSLWTLPHEVRLYLILAVLWWLGIRVIKLPFLAFAKGVTAVGFLLLFGLVIQSLSGVNNNFLTHAAMFFGGGIYYLHRSAIRICWQYVVGVCISIGLIWFFLPSLVIACCALVLPYLVFAFAYLPKGRLRLYNRAGDYSYGLYIYAFPVQQFLVFVWPSMSPMQLAILSALMTLPIAIMSWYCVEKPAVAYGVRFMGRRQSGQ